MKTFYLKQTDKIELKDDRVVIDRSYYDTLIDEIVCNVVIDEYEWKNNYGRGQLNFEATFEGLEFTLLVIGTLYDDVGITGNNITTPREVHTINKEIHIDEVQTFDECGCEIDNNFNIVIFINNEYNRLNGKL